jgi:enoyl-CoA hydratase
VNVRYETRDRVAVITIDRPQRRNAIDRQTAEALLAAWRRFDADDAVDVGVLYGAGGTFSAGADLKTFDLVDRPEGYLGFTRIEVSKPTIAAIEGHCVAGGLEMALWCDLRIAGRSAVFGCFERRFGVPLVDGGTQRLPRIVGRGIALEMILTGRPVDAAEAFDIGLANLVVEDGRVLSSAVKAARGLTRFPQETLRSDRRSLIEGSDLPIEEGLQVERRYGSRVLDVAREGAARFASGAGRSGSPVEAASRRSEPPRSWANLDAPVVDGALELVVDGRPVPTLVATPVATVAPAVLVIHDRWGLDSHVRAVVDALAEAGFLAAGVGLLDSVHPTEAEQVDRRVADLSPGKVGRILGSAVHQLGSLPSARGRVGVLGFGMGGGLAMWLATTEKDVSGCVAYTPSSPWPGLRPEFSATRAAFLGHYGGLDEIASVHTADQLEGTLRSLGVDATFEAYRMAGTEFYRSDHPAGDDRAAAELAWARTVAFFSRVL